MVSTLTLVSQGLNPCFSGIYSLRTARDFADILREGLNPCFSGIYSLSLDDFKYKSEIVIVLILVLVEYTL